MYQSQFMVSAYLAGSYASHLALVGVGCRQPKINPEDPPDHSVFRYYAVL